jgi:hypothetical protein
MTTELVPAAPEHALVPIDLEAASSAMEHVLATGDLAQFTPKQRVGYYLWLCQKLSIDSTSRPFDWLVLDGRLVLYPNKSCAEQLRRRHQISVELVRKEVSGDFFVVEVRGWRPNGQQDFASKYVPLRDGRGNRLAGQQYVNALAKAETGAKRRLTFSMVGLAAVPDTDDLRHARVATVDANGNVLDRPTEQQRHLAEHPGVARVIGEPTYETTATAEDSPVQGGPSQAPTEAELEPPKRTGPRPTLRPTKEQVDGWQRTWFATVKGSSLGSDDARHRYVEQWTCSMPGWPVAKQTDSLRTMFGRMTEREAEDFLGHTRALVEDEHRANEEALAEARGEGIPPAEAHDEEPF